MFLARDSRGCDKLFYGTRYAASGKLRLSKVNKRVFGRSLEDLGPKMFNKIPAKIKIPNSTFCMKVFEWLSVQSNIDYMYDVVP